MSVPLKNDWTYEEKERFVESDSESYSHSTEPVTTRVAQEKRVRRSYRAKRVRRLTGQLGELAILEFIVLTQRFTTFPQ